MKKLFGCILSLVMAVMLVFTPAEHVYAQGLGLSVSSSSVAVGKTVKVRRFPCRLDILAL